MTFGCASVRVGVAGAAVVCRAVDRSATSLENDDNTGAGLVLITTMIPNVLHDNEDVLWYVCIRDQRDLMANR